MSAILKGKAKATEIDEVLHGASSDTGSSSSASSSSSESDSADSSSEESDSDSDSVSSEYLNTLLERAKKNMSAKAKGKLPEHSEDILLLGDDKEDLYV